MLDRLTGKNIHLYVHLVSCALIVAGLPTTKILLSLGTFLGVLNTVLEADFRQYGYRLRTNRVAWGFWAFIIIQLLSLLWTSDWTYALHDLRVKLPLYFIPLFLICKPITDKKHFILLIGIFLAVLFTTSLINIGSYQHWWGTKTYTDIRGLSLFGSHIRYSLLIVMGIVLCIQWICQNLPYKWIGWLLIVWWVYYTYFAQILSGYFVLGVILLVSLILVLSRIQKTWLRISVFGTAVLLILTATVFILNFLQPEPHKIDMHKLPKYTINGNPYSHDTINLVWENGYPVVAFINEDELSNAWNAVSDIDYYDGLDAKNHALNYTLWQYMASKGYSKDSMGFSAMDATDIANVENGYPSINLAKGGLLASLSSLKMQLEHPQDPNGHSLLQRIEYWKAGINIIRENWITGVGAGDLQQAFNHYYTSSNTLLRKDLWLRAHNQYLTSWISAGILGFLSFLAWWMLFFRKCWKQKQFVGSCFALIAMCSFLVEDTIETQVGLTFIAFFYGLLVSSPLFEIRKSEV